ncbi:MAG: lysine transporter LysE [Chitinophagaceae bacterium]
MLKALIKGVTLGLLLAISVGPIVFTVIKQSLTNGRKSGLVFIAGISFSDILLVTLANLFTNLFDVIAAHKKTLVVIASVFLIVLGVYFLFFKKAKEVSIRDDKKPDKGHYLKKFIGGFIMNIFNPGIIVFWLTTATTFVDHTLGQRTIIFGTALLLALAADIAKVLLANTLRKKLTTKNIHLINQINGAILIAFGIGIILMQS